MIACIKSTTARKLKYTFHKLKHLETFHYFLNKVPHSLDILAISDIYQIVQLSAGS